MSACKLGSMELGVLMNQLLVCKWSSMPKMLIAGII
jgi:hypothetical protein